MSQPVVKQIVALGALAKAAAVEGSGVAQKQAILKNMLLNLNKLKYNQAKANKFSEQLRKQHYNKGNNLQSLNDLQMFNHQIYQFNRNNEINTVLLDRRVAKLIKQFINVSAKVGGNEKNSGKTSSSGARKKMLPIYISEPVFKHTTSEVEITFYYYNNFEEVNNRGQSFYNQNYKYYIPLINKLFNSLTGNGGDSKSMNKIFETYYNKKVKIVPKKIKYLQNNASILAQYLSQQYLMNPRFDKKFTKVVADIIPNIADETAAIDYNLRLISNVESKIKSVDQQLKNSFNPNLDLTKIYSNDKDAVAKSLVMFKYLIGAQIINKGRSASQAAISRARTDKTFKGTFRNKIFNSNKLSNQYKLNLVKSNISNYNSPVTTKFGRYNIGVKTNYL